MIISLNSLPALVIRSLFFPNSPLRNPSAVRCNFTLYHSVYPGVFVLPASFVFKSPFSPQILWVFFLPSAVIWWEFVRLRGPQCLRLLGRRIFQRSGRQAERRRGQ